MSTHNIRFCGEIRKILCGYPLLSVAMFYSFQKCGQLFKKNIADQIVLPLMIDYMLLVADDQKDFFIVD